MKVLFDSSAFSKRYIEEVGSQEVETVCQEATEVGLSVICLPEIISALNRRLREECIRKIEYDFAKQTLLEEISDIQIINLTNQVIRKTGTLLETNVLRAMDALHIACAIEWEADLFVTSDKRQERAAKNAGLMTRFC